MSPDRLRYLLHYDAETGIFRHIIARGPCSAGAVAGCINAIGYVRICVDYVDYAAHRLAWIYVHGVMPPDQIDHINGRRDDNRLCNLRLADNSQNNQNRPLQSNSTSGFKGVSLHKKSGLWFAYAQAKGIRKSAGYHRTAEEASIAAIAMRSRLHGEFSNNDRKDPKPCGS